MTGSDDNNLNDRRANLDAALAKKVGEKKGQVDTDNERDSAGWGAAVKISSEFISGVLVGAGIGYLIDKIAGTSPWGLIVFLLLGFAAGTFNVMRASGNFAEPESRMPDKVSDKDKPDADRQ
ncbi:MULTISPECIES: ATP synthase subunit [Ahrensia]|uniref:ATP synthase protein I n=1 Tax=Ahrensia kielensis TaxID=76980 RepID=A0ABU9T8Z8_9HYPH|nr:MULTISPECIES: ATP synthase subunit [Ahrensia]